MSSESDSSHPPITVGYWGIRGLGAPLRMMVMYSGVPLNAINYDGIEDRGEGASVGAIDRSQWLNAKPELKKKHPLINLPYLVINRKHEGKEDLIINQSNACLVYLGKKLNMYGSDEEEGIECDQLLCESMDVRNTLVQYCYPEYPDNNPPAVWLKSITSSGRSLDKLNEWLARKYPSSEAQFFVGNAITAPDFPIWEILDQMIGFASFYHCDYPLSHLSKLKEFYEFFQKLPNNQRFFSSKLYHLPANFLSAKTYGATPDGGKFVFGENTPLPWTGTSGIY
jgi:hypothetical protein